MRLVVLDWDGTLADSAGRIVDCLTQAVRAIGATLPSEERMRETIGLPLPEVARHLVPDAAEHHHEALVAAYRTAWLAPNAPVAQLFPEARECLHALRERGYLLAVATGRSRRGLDVELDQTATRELFAATRTADETAGKPDPRMLHELLAELAMPASRAVMVGDTSYDIEMARAASVSAIAVASGNHSRDRLLAAGAARCIDRIGELLDAIG